MGGGADVFVWVFLKGHALIHSKKWEGHDYFRKKILKYPGPPLPAIKYVPSLRTSSIIFKMGQMRVRVSYYIYSFVYHQLIPRDQILKIQMERE